MGENRFGFSRNLNYRLHTITSLKVELTTHLQSKNTNEMTSTSNFIVFLDYYDAPVLKIERHRSYMVMLICCCSEYH